ncbi:hypothetical protein Cni_G19987 [Canna indica]|uniref:Uncharacterized protein n=1 Tax=Canna indica TaxID=4628 RepID=A0AAQ3KN93_9LILI|nr:hypothetical protein Cni_G19987 [Canna indica]
MGNAQSPPADPVFDAASRAFSNQELEDLNSLFVSLAAQSGSNCKFISQSVFQAYFLVPGPLGARMFQLATRKRNDGMLTFEDLVLTKATYEKGARDEIEEFIYQLCDVTGDDILARSDLVAVLNSINEAIFCPKSDDISLRSNQDILEVFINAAMFSEKVERLGDDSMSLADFRSWCGLLPSARKFLGSLLMPPDSVFCRKARLSSSPSTTSRRFIF